jgi:hypothetical protein
MLGFEDLTRSLITNFENRRRAYLSIIENDAGSIRQQVERMRRADTSSGLVHGMLLAIEAVQLDDPAFASRVTTYASANVPDWISVLRILRIYRPDRADMLLDRTRPLSSPVANFASGATIQLAGAQGRWRALDSLRAAGSPGAGSARRNACVAGAIGGVGDDQRARRAVAALSAGLLPDSASRCSTSARSGTTAG